MIGFTKPLHRQIASLEQQIADQAKKLSAMETFNKNRVDTLNADKKRLQDAVKRLDAENKNLRNKLTHES